MLNSKVFVRELQLRHESAWMNPNGRERRKPRSQHCRSRATASTMPEARLESFRFRSYK